MPPERGDQPRQEGYPANTQRIFAELAGYMDMPGGLDRMNAVASIIVGNSYDYDSKIYKSARDGFYDLVGSQFPAEATDMKFAPQSQASEKSAQMANRVVTLATILFGVDKMMQGGTGDESLSVEATLDMLEARYASQVTSREEIRSLDPMQQEQLDEVLGRMSPYFLGTIGTYAKSHFEDSRDADQTVADREKSLAIALTAATITYASLDRSEDIPMGAGLTRPPVGLPPRRAAERLPDTHR